MRTAEAAGLDVNDSHHMEELYAFYLVGLLPSLKAIQAMDMSDAEPALFYVPPRE